MKKSGFLLFGTIIFLMPVLVSANVVINEIAWMGSKVDGVDSSKWQYYEWLELKNNGNADVDLTGWTLSIVGKKDITFETAVNKIIPANDFYFIERSGYHAFSNISADLAISFGNGIPNSGATLVLKDASGQPVDTVDGSDNWKIGGGDIVGNNTTKETAQLTSLGWITATATPKAANAGASQSQSSQSSQFQTSSSSAGAGNLDNSQYVQPEKLPHIKADAGKDRTVMVGAAVEFRGHAFGLNDKPLDNARYLWTFGDGASKEGQNVGHIYQYPGEYIAALNVSSGEYSASDYILIKAIPNQVFISEIKTAGNDSDAAVGASWIEFENKSKEEIDISGCQISARGGSASGGKYNNQSFIFPISTRIRPAAFLVIPSSVSGIVLNDGNGVVEFLYSGGFKADNFSYNGFLQSGQSFNRGDAGSLIGLATPGAKNSVVVASSKNILTSENKNILPKSQNKNKIPDSSSGQKNQEENNNQTANIITTGDSVVKSNTLIYLVAIGGLILFTGAAVFLIRRKRGI